MNIKNSNFSWKLEAFDSEVLGFPVAKIISINAHESSFDADKVIQELIKDLRAKKIYYATCRVDSANFFLTHALERAGFILVDGFLSFEKILEDIPEDRQIEIRVGRKEDLKSLGHLGCKVFFLNRLYNDPFIPREKADSFYSRWTQNCLLGKAADLVLIFQDKRRILGFVALQKKGHIPLIGVDSEYRGRGIAKKLIKASFPYFLKWNNKIVTISTQLSNIAAIRAYTSCGFSATYSKFSFVWHR